MVDEQLERHGDGFIQRLQVTACGSVTLSPGATCRWDDVTSSAVPAELDRLRKPPVRPQARNDRAVGWTSSPGRRCGGPITGPTSTTVAPTIAGRPVCRRCLTLYPVAIAVGIAFLLGWSLWPAAADPWLIWALCLPATADFVLEQTGTVDYSARRQVLTTALLAPAVGRAWGMS